MQVIVAKKNHPQYIGLSSTGQFIKFRNNSQLQIGEMADIKPNTFSVAPRLVAGIAAAIFLTSASIFGYAYSVPVNYLYVDINPSIELTVNCFDRVISAKGLNTDGEVLLSETSLNYISTEKSIEKILEKSVEKGYMAENLENVVLLNTSGDEKVLKGIKEKVTNFTENGGLKNIKPEVQVESIDNTQVQEAKKQHISAGKLKLIEKATLKNPQLSKEQMVDMPVRDIIKEIKKEKTEEIKSKIEAKKKEVLKKDTDKVNEAPKATKRPIYEAPRPNNKDIQPKPDDKPEPNNKRKEIIKAKLKKNFEAKQNRNSQQKSD